MNLLDFLLRFVPLEEVPNMASRHGVVPLLYDEIAASGKNPGGQIWMMKLAGHAHRHKMRYAQQKEAIEALAALYAEHGIRMLVFKGYALSLLYPTPESRRCGDVDIYLFGDGEKADKLLQQLGVDVLLQVDKHSAFDWKEVHFENHATFIGLRGNKQMQMVEQFLEDEVYASCKEDETISNVYVPNANFNALFIPLHFAGHWVRSELSLRMLYDWAIFLEKCHDEVDWPRVMGVAKEIGFDHFLYAMNLCVVRTFGLDEQWIGTDHPDEELAKEIFNDTISPQKIMEIPEDAGFLRTCWLKSIRFIRLNSRRNKVRKQNLFKSFYYQTLCYLHFKTNIDKRTVWEMDYAKSAKREGLD